MVKLVQKQFILQVGYNAVDLDEAAPDPRGLLATFTSDALDQGGNVSGVGVMPGVSLAGCSIDGRTVYLDVSAPAPSVPVTVTVYGAP